MWEATTSRKSACGRRLRRRWNLRTVRIAVGDARPTPTGSTMNRGSPSSSIELPHGESLSCDRRCGIVAAVALLVAVTAAVFGRVCCHGFLLYDDAQHVSENPLLDPVTWHSVGEFWRRPYFGLYIPLSYTFFAAEASIARQPLPDGIRSDPNPQVFHLGNPALHVACVLLVFVILRRLLRHNGAACAGALLFALHPVQVESVAWISETRGVLCGLFSLLAVWQYLAFADASGGRKLMAKRGVEMLAQSGATGVSPVHGQDAPGTRQLCKLCPVLLGHYAAATVAFALALLCKPAAVAVPLVAGVLALGMPRRPVRRILSQQSQSSRLAPRDEASSCGARWLPTTLVSLIPWLVISGAWVVLTKVQQPNADLPFVADVWARVLLAGDALAFYLIKLILPLRCVPDYGHAPQWVMAQWWFYVGWMLPVAAVVVLTRMKDRRIWLTAAAVFVACLLPVLGLVPFSFQRISTVADRYVYLAMLGPALALGWFLAHHWNRRGLAAAGVVFGLLGVLTFVQTGYWRNNESLIAHMLEVNPHSVLARQHRGFLLAQEGRHDEAIDWYRAALADHPMHPELYRSLATSLDVLGRSEEAAGELVAVLAKHPRWSLVRCKLAELLRKQGAINEAIKQYRTALRHDGDCATAHLQLGKLLLDSAGSEEVFREGIEHLEEALDDVHTRVQAYVDLGRAAEGIGKPIRARRHYEQALQWRPQDVVARYNLANLLAAAGETEAASDHYRRVLALDPKYARAHVNLGVLLFRGNDIEGAVERYRAALRLDPKLVEAHVNLGVALAAGGDKEAAAAAFRRALQSVSGTSQEAAAIRRLLESVQ